MFHPFQAIKCRYFDEVFNLFRFLFFFSFLSLALLHFIAMHELYSKRFYWFRPFEFQQASIYYFSRS